MSARGPDRRILPLLALAAAAFAATAGRACGLCDEDKVAATYDHAVVTAAASQHHRMMFAALVGPLVAGDAAIAGRLTRALERTPGVDARTARVSLSPAAVSFAWDPAKTTRDRLLAAATRSLAPHGLRLRPIDAVLPAGAVTLQRTKPR